MEDAMPAAENASDALTASDAGEKPGGGMAFRVVSLLVIGVFGAAVAATQFAPDATANAMDSLGIGGGQVEAKGKTYNDGSGTRGSGQMPPATAGE